MTQDLMVEEPREIKKENKTFNFEITSLTQAMEYAKLISESDLAPKDYRGKPGNVLIAIQFGMEVGLKPMQAIQNIAVINGRPSIWGDAMIALVQSHPACEYISEYMQNGAAFCAVKRRGEEEHVTKFSFDDAKKAGLAGKPGPWSQYPERMLQMRARSFALRDKFSDVLKGISMREEVEDYVVDITPAERKSEAQSKISLLLNEKKDNVLSKIEDAQSIDELKEIKDKIANSIRQRKEELTKDHPAETGEISE